MLYWLCPEQHILPPCPCPLVLGVVSHQVFHCHSTKHHLKADMEMEGLVWGWRNYSALPDNVLFFSCFRKGKYKFNLFFCTDLEKNANSSNSLALNVRLSFHWAGSVCWGGHQWKEKKLSVQNHFSGHKIVVSGYYPVYTFCSCVAFAEQWAQRQYST